MKHLGADIKGVQRCQGWYDVNHHQNKIGRKSELRTDESLRTTYTRHQEQWGKYL